MFLSEHLAKLSQAPVEDELRDRALQHFIDWLLASLVGLKLNVGSGIITLTKNNRSGGRATTLGIGDCDIMTALIHNAALGNAAELDDYHRSSVTHPGPIVIPVALGVAQQGERDIRDFLDGIVVGYEVMARMGSAVGKKHYRHWHKTATCGTFAATATAVRVNGYNKTIMQNALGHAGSMAGGIWECRTEATETKQLHSSHAAMSGYLCATAAQAGLRGPSAVLEGEYGYFSAACPDPETSFLEAPLTRWSLWDTSLKPWPCCRHTHSTVLALQKLFLEYGPFVPDDISKIEISTFSEAIKLCDQAAPTHETAGRFSLQHVAAVTILHGKPELNDFNAGMRDDPIISRLRDLIQIKECSDATRDYPVSAPATVALTTLNGQTFSSRVERGPGDPELPLTRQQMQDKVKDILDFLPSGVDPALIADIYTAPEYRHLNMASIRDLLDCFCIRNFNFHT